MRYELKPFGIRVKIVEPGGIRSNFSHAWATAQNYEPIATSVRETMMKGQQRAALPEVVARAIVVAANDRSDRLRYPASDAGLLFGIRKFLPDRVWRVFIGKIFGLF